MTLQRAHQKTFARGLKLMLVAGLVGQLLPGTVHAQGKGDNSGNPSILEAVKAVEKGVIGLQATLDALQVLVDTYGQGYRRVLELAKKLPDGTEPLCPSNPEIVAQLHHAVSDELAVSLQDVLLRRTGIGEFFTMIGRKQ